MNPIIEINVTDEIEPFLQQMSAKNQKALRSAAKSLGWFMQKEIKQGVKSGSPGGLTYRERLPHNLRKALQGGSAAKQWYGKMLRAIGYQYKDGVLSIGWTSRTSAMYGRKQEFSYKTKVTDAIRKKFGEAGVPLRESTKYLYLPERPIFEPMAGELQPQVAPFILEKMANYADGNVQFAKKSRRKYKVYG